jgi:hypothetical protein
LGQSLIIKSQGSKNLLIYLAEISIRVIVPAFFEGTDQAGGGSS